MKYLFVVGDDFGFSPGVNRGSLEALESGLLQNLSFMVNSPGSNEAAKLVGKQHLEKHVGLHVTLNNLNKTGIYLRSSDYVDLLQSESAKKLQHLVSEEFKVFEDLFSTHPAFLNSHQNLHQHEKIRETIAEYAQRYYLFVRRTNRFKSPNLLKENHENSANQYFQDQGVKLTEFIFEPGAGTFDEVLKGFLTDLNTVPDNSTTEIFFHPGLVDPILAKYSSMTHDRERDLKILTNTEFKEEILNLGFTLAAFSA